MNCANHQDREAAAYCRECGKPMCSDCQFRALGSIYCGEHAPATVTVAPELPPAAPLSPPAPFTESTQESPRDYRTFAAETPQPASDLGSSPYTAPNPKAAAPVNSAPNTHPALALFLGFIPGVGAIYNGQYAKGLIHAVVFGLLVTVESRGVGGLEPLVGMLIAAWVFYMAFEAFHTAMNRRKGVVVDEFSSLIDVRPSQGRFPVGAVALIGLGFILLLDTTEIINMEQIARFWPVGLIVLGGYMLYERVSQRPADEGNTPESAEARR